MGCAGDMLMGALSELVDQKAFIEKMNALNLPEIHFEAVPTVKCGILGTHMKVTVQEEEEHSEEDHSATFFFHVENADDHAVAHILDHIEEIEGIRNVAYDGDTLSYTFDHDHGDVAENRIREIFADHLPDAVLVSHGHSHHEHVHEHEHHHGMHLKDVNGIIDSECIGKCKEERKSSL